MKQLALTITGPKGDIDINPPGNVPSGGFSETGGIANAIVIYGLDILLAAAVLIALIYLIFGGIQWISSGGDKTKLQSARNKMVYAIIGLVVAFLAYFIVGLVSAFFRVDFFGS